MKIRGPFESHKAGKEASVARTESNRQKPLALRWHKAMSQGKLTRQCRPQREGGRVQERVLQGKRMGPRPAKGMEKKPGWYGSKEEWYLKSQLKKRVLRSVRWVSKRKIYHWTLPLGSLVTVPKATLVLGLELWYQGSRPSLTAVGATGNKGEAIGGCVPE